MKTTILFTLVLVTFLILSSGCLPTPDPTPTPTQPPVISNINPRCGNPGELLTITGSGFGAAQGTSRVFIGSTEASVHSWSTTEIQVRIPVGATTGNVTVQVAGQTSNGILFTIPCHHGVPVVPVNTIDPDIPQDPVVVQDPNTHIVLQ